MRKINFAVALVAVLGWAISAHAGSVTQSWSISDNFGATGNTFVFGFPSPVPTTSVMGTLKVVVTTPNSTFASSVPPSSASVHVVSQKVTANGKATGSGWTVTGSVMAKAAGSTMCHIGASGMIAGSCSATFQVRTRAHCTGTHGAGSTERCSTATDVPGNWTAASDAHTQTWWTAKSVHLGGATVSHAAGSNHYLKSFQATLIPTANRVHRFLSKSSGHLASSNPGFHTFHVGAKQTQ